MKQTLKEYISNIHEKTIIIFCNDCHAANEVIPKENFMVYTLFGNIITAGNTEDLTLFKHCILFEGVKRIIVAGHYHCRILKFLSENRSEPHKWEEAKAYTKNLENNFSLFKYNGNAEKELIRYHITTQVRELSEMDFFRDKLYRKQISIQGILVDDTKGNEVEVIRHTAVYTRALHMN